MVIPISGSIDANAETLIDVIRAVRGRIDRNKNTVCIAIDLSEKTIVDWYNEITCAYAPFRAHFILGKQVTEEILTEYLIFAYSRTNSHAIKSSIAFLQEISNKYERGELRNLIGKLDMSLLTKFCNSLEDFQNYVFDEKVLHLDDLVKKNGTKEDDKKIEKWIKNLDNRRDNVRNNAMEILKQLGCREEMFKKITNTNNSKK